MIETYKLVITGQVQGVGFRPHVYNLASKFGLKGTVSNNEEGVIIYAQAPREQVYQFYEDLIENPPVVSKISDHSIVQVEFKSFDDFKIISTDTKNKLNLQLTPDFGICANCQRDIDDPANRRYKYPFTTCVNCGPRWAITTSFPFERYNTSMSKWKMCKECEEEYANPEDRRFHSQTNSCALCGINLYLLDREAHKIELETSELFVKLKDLLLRGHIIAIKNTSGYLLCCDARNTKSVQNLRRKKYRPQKPFAVLYPSLEYVKSQFKVSDSQEEALKSAVRPIVIIRKEDRVDDEISLAVAPGLKQLGVMLPNSGVLQLLANEINFPIVATSGNSSGSPVISDNNKALEKLKTIADYFVQHNLEITHSQDDSVLKFGRISKTPVLFRRSRGYAPNYFNFRRRREAVIMAMGGHLKSTIAYFPNDYLYVSQYLGNLDSYEVYERFVKTASEFTTIFKQRPKVILVDKHPGYQSTLHGMELSKSYSAKLNSIQHHKAHLASVLGEYQLFEAAEPVLGVVWDGTGYGDDGNIWGGEFFKYDRFQMQRVAHFDYFDWLAKEKMAKEPRLSLLSLLDKCDEHLLAGKFSDEEFIIYTALKQRNNLKTSSVGRLFDAVASLLNICDTNTYEGEAAIKLENALIDYDLEAATCYVSELQEGIIPTKTILERIISDVEEGIDRSVIIANFLFTLSTIITMLARHYSITKIACSGGVFQNTVLVDMLYELSGEEFELYFNRNFSPNDENISFGQIMYHLHGIDKK